VITEQRYNNLNSINRFIRTVCNRMRKNKQMNSIKLNRFIKTYKGTIYQTTGVSPSKMQDNKDQIKCQRQSNANRT
jgi:hypothetical protein